MGQKKSVKVPADLMGVVGEFHKIRQTISAAIAEMEVEAEAFNRSVKGRSARLEMQYQNALLTVRDALIAGKLVTETQVFTIDTLYLEEHGEAYLRVEGDAAEVEPERTIH